MRNILAIALLAASPAAADPYAPTASPAQRILATGDGLTQATAYKVDSVRDEYVVAAALGLQVRSQSLVFDRKAKKTYDKLTLSAPTGESKVLWFDISSFALPE